MRIFELAFDNITEGNGVIVVALLINNAALPVILCAI